MGVSTRELTVYSLQLAVGCVFLAAAAGKATNIGAFRLAVASHAVMPVRLVSVAAPALVLLEFLVALALMLGYIVAVAGSIAIVMLSLFAMSIVVNLSRGRRIPCGCFGSKTEEISPRSLLRIALLVVPTIVLLAVGGSTLTVGVFTENGPQSLFRLVEAAGLAAFMLAVGAWLLAIPESANALQIRRLRQRRTSAQVAG